MLKDTLKIQEDTKKDTEKLLERSYRMLINAHRYFEVLRRDMKDLLGFAFDFYVRKDTLKIMEDKEKILGKYSLKILGLKTANDTAEPENHLENVSGYSKDTRKILERYLEILNRYYEVFVKG